MFQAKLHKLYNYEYIDIEFVRIYKVLQRAFTISVRSEQLLEFHPILSRFHLHLVSLCIAKALLGIAVTSVDIATATVGNRYMLTNTHNSFTC